jgi:hypothetical protein
MSPVDLRLLQIVLDDLNAAMAVMKDTQPYVRVRVSCARALLAGLVRLETKETAA